MKNDCDYLGHILEAIEKIETLIVGFDLEKFSEDYRTHAAVIYLLTIIGEAANNLSEEIYEKHSEVPWESVIGMRNVVVHAYFKVDLKVIWETATVDLPILKKQIQSISESL